MKHRSVQALCEGAVMAAMAQLVGYLKLWEMPWGGSVTLSMVPILLYAIRWGLDKGLAVSFAVGALQFIFDGGFAIGWQAILGDYLLAYGVLGLAALPRRTRSGIYPGTLLACGIRFLVHYAVGATVWAEYMPESFFGLPMHSPWFYSALYNLAYMIPNTAVTLTVLALLRHPLRRYIVPM